MARKKKHPPHEEHMGEAWLLPYSDLMTLLLALFIALFAMSQTDATKMQQMAHAFTAAFNMGGPSFFSGMGPNVSSVSGMLGGPDNGNGAYLAENQALEEVQFKLEEYIRENSLEGEVSTELSEEGLMIRLSEEALFSSGSAELESQALEIVPVIASLLTSIPQTVTITGHTDNIPIVTAQYPSNWELSSSRAVNFMRGLMNSQPSLNPSRFSALGYSEYRPVASNDTEEGRAKNRRVEVFVARSLRFNPNEGTSAGSNANNARNNQPASSTINSSGLPVTGTVNSVSEGQRALGEMNKIGILPDPLSY